MKKEIQQQIFEKYPKIFRQTKLPMTETCMCWGLEIGKGWSKIIDQLCGSIQNIIDNHKHSIKLKEEKTVTYNRGNGEIVSYQATHDTVPNPQVEFSQVKEKFGGLRVYTDVVYPPKETTEMFDEDVLQKHFRDFQSNIDGMINFAEYMAANTCEICGKDGTMCVRGGWYKTLCPECAKQNEYKTTKEI